MAKKEFEEKEMTTEEARAFRASLHVNVARVLPEHEKREQFRVFWAKNRLAYGKEKKLENVLWIHLKSTKCDSPENFEKGLMHFGLKKIK